MMYDDGNNVEKLFKEDSRDKKAVSRSARNKRSGSRTKYVSLPSDHMTEAQWKRRNGEVKLYNLDAPISFKEFKSYPVDLKNQYLRNLDAKFHGISLRSLAEAWGISVSTMLYYTRDIDKSIFNLGKKMTKKDRCELQTYLAEKKQEAESKPKKTITKNPATEAEESSVPQREEDGHTHPTTYKPISIDAFEFTLNGVFYRSALDKYLECIPEGQEVVIKIQVEVKK